MHNEHGADRIAHTRRPGHQPVHRAMPFGRGIADPLGHNLRIIRSDLLCHGIVRAQLGQRDRSACPGQFEKIPLRNAAMHIAVEQVENALIKIRSGLAHDWLPRFHPGS